MKMRRIIKVSKVLAIVAAFSVVAVALAWFVFAVAVRFAPPLDIDSLYGRNSSSTLTDRNGVILRAYLAPDQRWRIPILDDEVTTAVRNATLAVEDKRFFEHGGVDVIAVVRAALLNIAERRTISGASTLTMQAAMFDQTKAGRTLGWKARQVWRALRLERELSKPDILALYLSNAPYGGNIHGIEAASQRYFGMPSKNLNLSRAALLAGIPQSPTRLRPDRNLSATLVRRSHVLDLMLAQGRISAAEAGEARAHIPRIENASLPMLAPHFSDFVHARFPRDPRVRTTLDIQIQTLAENSVRQKVAQIAPRGVSNGAAIVQETQTGQVLAMVGSVDFADKSGGQVNGAYSLRSPGSTLKPLIYAYAFDQGVLLPQTVLPDVPLSWSGYVPENFTRSFRGTVRADHALALSLNIPAIEVLRTVGVTPTVEFLRTCGLETIDPIYKTDQNPRYGLSLAIGSCGVRLLDLTNAYAMLGRGGQWLPYSLRTDTKTPAEPQRRLSSGAAWFTLQSLSDSSVERSVEGVNATLYGLKNVVWKTGTSGKNRDAWTVAMDEQYTVGVWFGNFSGKASPLLVGADTAAPVALGLLRDLRKARGGATQPGGTWPTAPKDGMGETQLCTVSGLPALGVCPTIVRAAGILTSPISQTMKLPPPCNVHRQMLIDADSGYEVCEQCMEGRRCKPEVYVFWPANIASLMERYGEKPRPQHNPQCPGVARRDEAPRIISPTPDTRYIEDISQVGLTQKIELKAAAPADAKRLWWFANSVPIGTCAPTEPFWWVPAAGEYTLRVSDEQGRTATVHIYVEKP